MTEKIEPSLKTFPKYFNLIQFKIECLKWKEDFEAKMRNLMLIYGDDPDIRLFIKQEILG